MIWSIFQFGNWDFFPCCFWVWQRYHEWHWLLNQVFIRFDITERLSFYDSGGAIWSQVRKRWTAAAAREFNIKGRDKNESKSPKLSVLFHGALQTLSALKTLHSVFSVFVSICNGCKVCQMGSFATLSTWRSCPNLHVSDSVLVTFWWRGFPLIPESLPCKTDAKIMRDMRRADRIYCSECIPRLASLPFPAGYSPFVCNINLSILVLATLLYILDCCESLQDFIEAALYLCEGWYFNAKSPPP